MKYISCCIPFKYSLIQLFCLNDKSSAFSSSVGFLLVIKEATIVVIPGQMQLLLNN